VTGRPDERDPASGRRGRPGGLGFADADWRFLAGAAVVFAAIAITWVAVGSTADGIPAGLFAVVLAVLAERRRRS
jgi:hypothetical protein